MSCTDPSFAGIYSTKLSPSTGTETFCALATDPSSFGIYSTKLPPSIGTETSSALASISSLSQLAMIFTTQGCTAMKNTTQVHSCSLMLIRVLFFLELEKEAVLLDFGIYYTKLSPSSGTEISSALASSIPSLNPSLPCLMVSGVSSGFII